MRKKSLKKNVLIKRYELDKAKPLTVIDFFKDLSVHIRDRFK